MHEAFWNGLFDVRWEEAPLGAEAIRLTVRLRERGYAGRTCRDYGHAVVHLGRFLHEERGSDQVRGDGGVTDFLGGHLTTVVTCRRCLRDFLVSRGDAVSPAELVALSADDLLAFSRQRGAGLGCTARDHLATALSGLYRWLDLCGHGGAQLVGAVPLRRRYRLAGVPCALSWEQVRRLPGAVELREPNGRRG